MCDRIMVMKKGELMEIGKAEEIYTNPKNSYTQQLIKSSQF
jgi:ABC-type dipeptide/oligopeptide/nickel transport system ATPase component